MARIGSIERMGYYPTPPNALRRIPYLLTAQPHAYIRLYDPCAGQGEALAYIASQLPARTTTYGVEISAPRAQLASQVLDHTLHSDYENAKITALAFSFIVTNPPYDLEGANDEHQRRNRLEYTFLRNSLGKLQIGGVLCYIVPQPILTIPHVLKFLSAHLDRISVYRFPQAEFEIFDQIVLFAYRKAQSPYDPAEVKRLNQLGIGVEPIPELPAAPDQVTKAQRYHIPTATLPDEKLLFQRAYPTAQELLQLYQQQNAFQTDAWRTFAQPAAPSSFTPLIPLRQRHVAALISSGQIGSVTLPDPRNPNQTILVKGITEKVIIRHEEEGDDEKKFKNGNRVTVEETEEYRTTIYQLTPAGQHTTLNQTSEIEAFLLRHSDHLAQLIDQRYAALYREPTLDEWRHVSRLLPYKRLPGRNHAGLLDAQKHAAIAASRSARTYGWADLLGEMGSGKSATSLAAVDLLGAYPCWIEAPTHTLENWKNEIRQTIPEASAFIIRTLADLTTFQRNYRPGNKWFAIFSIEAAKLGPGWRPATLLRRKRVYLTHEDGTITKHIVTYHCCPRCGTPAWQAADAHTPPDVNDEDQEHLKRRQYCTAPTRRWQGDPAGDNRKGAWLHTDLTDVAELDTVGRVRGQTLRCGEPLFTFTGFRRWPLADYIKQKMPHFFQGGIADEVHKAKGKSSDSALAYHKLVDSTRYLFNLTGSYFGGYSSDLFWLRYRLDRAIRQEYSFHDEQRWVQHFGRVKRLVADEALYDSDGAFSGTHRYLIQTRELPGLSPLIYRHLLATTIFLRIEDLGYQLPPYEEQVVHLDMSPAQAADYDRLDTTLMEFIKENRGEYADEHAHRQAQALLPVWLQNCLGRPNSAFRHENILWKPPGAKEHVPFTIQLPADKAQPVTEREPPGREATGLITTQAESKGVSHTPPMLLVGLNNHLLDAPNPDEDLSLPAATIGNDQVGHFIDAFNQPFRPPDPNDLTISSHFLTNPTTVSVPFTLPSIIKGNDLLPKEAWLLDWATTELAQQRKILLYVRQTGTRDIQPRLIEVLSRANLRPLILPENVEAIKREAWIKSRMALLDILSTNPRRVETGINLVEFANICFYEIEYSLYTLLQAMRRVWRLGQTRPVKVVFPIYRGTLEEQAFYLMANKMAANRLLYGDNATGAFAGGSNDLSGNILSELARRLSRGQFLHNNGLTTLLTTNSTQTSEWAAIPSGPATPTLPTEPPIKAHPAPQPLLLDNTCSDLFATITNTKERRQRAAGQIGLFA